MSNSGCSYTSLREAKTAGGRWSLDDFVEVVNSLIERYLPADRTGNAKLRDAFNPRLVRYYSTVGLIASPEREGKEARYGYGHLLQALVIRRLLFQGFTAAALLKMLVDKTEADYETMLVGGVSVAAAPPAVAADTPPPPAHLRLAHELLSAKVAAPPRAPAMPGTTLLPRHAMESPAAAVHWRRLEIAPGLELHVRGDFRPPESLSERESLLRAVLDRL